MNGGQLRWAMAFSVNEGQTRLESSSESIDSRKYDEILTSRSPRSAGDVRNGPHEVVGTTGA